MTPYLRQLQILEGNLWRGFLKPHEFNLEVKQEARRLLRALRKEFVLVAKEEN